MIGLKLKVELFVRKFLIVFMLECSLKYLIIAVIVEFSVRSLWIEFVV